MGSGSVIDGFSVSLDTAASAADRETVGFPSTTDADVPSGSFEAARVSAGVAPAEASVLRFFDLCEVTACALGSSYLSPNKYQRHGQGR